VSYNFDFFAEKYAIEDSGYRQD